MAVHAPPSPARRAFLRGRGRAEAPIRPPGARPEPAFLDACTRCGDCVAACPERILLAGDGGFPVLDAGRGECTFCARCAESCGSQALLPALIAAWPWRAAIGAGCLAAAGVVCQACRDACPASAIRFPPTRGAPVPALQAEACTGCGACVAACPAQAIAMRRHEPAAEVPA